MKRKPAIPCTVVSVAAATAAAGSIQATLTNPSRTDTIYLNGIGSTASSPDLRTDTSPFDVNAPFYLNPGDRSGPFELFDVRIDPAAPADPYAGNFISIYGGAAGNASEDVAHISFDVQVTGTSGVPEIRTYLPGMARLVAVGLKKRGQR